MSDRIIYEGGPSSEGDMVQLGPTNGGIGRKDGPQRAAMGFLGMPEAAIFTLGWGLVVASVIVPWGLLLWWLSRVFVGM
jgi:hypothetical protein